MWSGHQKKFDQLLGQITDPNVIEQDFASVYQLCDLVKSNAVSPSVALAKLTKKLPPNNRDPMVNSLAWSCLDVMAKNCGSKFHEQLANQDFLQLVRDAIGASSEERRQKPLELLQSWALGIEQRDNTRLINTMYQSLKDHGYKFPNVNASELRAMYQTSIPAEWKDGKRCFRCRSEFTSFLRKHHCRNCGQVVCASCSSKKMALPHIGIEEDVRVCETCYNRRASTRAEFGLDENALSVTRQNFPLQGLVDSLQALPDEEAQLRWALEASRKEAEERDKRWTLFEQSHSATGQFKHASEPGQQSSGAYPDLQKFASDQETVFTGATMQSNKGATPLVIADYPLVSAKESLASFVHYPSPSSPSTSQSTGSVARFVRYNASAPSPADTQSEKGSLLSPGANSAATQDILNEQEIRRANSASKELTESNTAVDGLVKKIEEKIGLFNLRLRRNQIRRRSTANDQYARSLCIFLSELEPQLVDQLNELEERRVYYESLQDKLYEIIEIRKALEDLREEAHRKRLEKQGSIEQQRARLLEQKRAELRAEKMRRQPLLPPGHNVELFQWNREAEAAAVHGQSHLNNQNPAMVLQPDNRMLHPVSGFDGEPIRPVPMNTESFRSPGNANGSKVFNATEYGSPGQSTQPQRKYSAPCPANPGQFTSMRPNLLQPEAAVSMLSDASPIKSVNPVGLGEHPLRPELSTPSSRPEPPPASAAITTVSGNHYRSDVSGRLADIPSNINPQSATLIAYNKNDDFDASLGFIPSGIQKIDSLPVAAVEVEENRKGAEDVRRTDEEIVVPLVDDLLLNVENDLNDDSRESYDQHAEMVRPLTDKKDVVVE